MDIYRKKYNDIESCLSKLYTQKIFKAQYGGLLQNESPYVTKAPNFVKQNTPNMLLQQKMSSLQGMNINAPQQQSIIGKPQNNSVFAQKGLDYIQKFQFDPNLKQNIENMSAPTFDNISIDGDGSSGGGNGKIKEAIQGFGQNVKSALSNPAFISGAINAGGAVLQKGVTNLTGFKADSTSAMLDGIGNVAGKFGPVGLAVQGGLKAADLMSQLTGEVYQSFDGNTGTSGYRDFSMDKAQFRGSLSNPIMSAFTKSDQSEAHEQRLNAQKAQYAVAQTNVNQQQQQNQARQNTIQDVQMNNQQQLSGGLGYDAILAKNGGVIDYIEENIDFDDMMSLYYENINNENSIEAYKDGGSIDIDYSFDDMLQLYNDNNKEQVLSFKIGGSVIPSGALHKNKHHLNDDQLKNNITDKGIPVVTIEGDEIVQHAEIEKEEIILEFNLTKRLEMLWEDGSDEAMIEAGRLLSIEINKNTKDNTDVINNIKEDENKNK